MRTLTAIVVTALVFAPSGFAQAGTLYTPYLMPGLSDGLTCTAVNVGTKPRSVTIEILRDNGTAALGPVTFNDVPAGQVFVESTLDDRARYCKFTFKGGKKNIRGSVCIGLASEGHCIAALPAY